MNEDILKELKEQTKWLRFLALPNLPIIKKAIEENITGKEQKRIYDLSDGKNSRKKIANKLKTEGLKVSYQTVSNYWKKWFALGLVIPSGKQSGRFEKIIDLADLDIK